MNLRDLRYFVALADHRHFGRAAAACHVSQPTLSTQIKKLEDELQVALVERAPRKVMLTEAGGLIADRARRVLAEVDQMRHIARRTLDPDTGTLRLGLFPTLGPYLLPHVVAPIRSRFPRLELLLIEEKTEVLLQQLRDGRLDAALLALPIHDETLEAQVLFDEPFVLAVPEGHALSNRRALTVKALRDEHLLLLEDGHCLRDQALDVCQLAGAGEKEGFRATSLETLRQMVAAGVGITLLPQLSVVPPVPPSPNLRLLPFAKPAPYRRIALVWRRSSARSEFLHRLAALVADLAAAKLAPRSDCMTEVVRVAFGRDFVVSCPPLPAALGAWTLTFYARDQDAERLTWMRRRWGQHYWEHAFVEVEGHPRCFAATPDTTNDNHVLARVAFMLSDALLADIRAGALLGVGVDHPRHAAVVALRSADRQRLWQHRPDA